MTRRQFMDNMKCKHCGSDDVIFEDRDYQEVEFGRCAPQIWTWRCLECDKTNVTIEYSV